MTDNDIFYRVLDELVAELDGMPLHIERPGQEDFVLVASATYSALLKRIYDLEQAAMIRAEREAEEERLLRAMVDANNSGRLH